MSFVEQIEVNRLAVLCGIFSKEELIKFLDKIIANLDEPPYEIIEASLVFNSNMQDALHILRDYFYRRNGDDLNIHKELLHIISDKYQANEININDSIYYLDNLMKEANLDNEITSIINYLSDGLYLAEQKIYGDLETIEDEFIKFILKY
ncbi:hypothetical protein [Clostridium saccharobutylicum]|uniref:Uncharacterized protein n=1 Tax=Clostridium saccharobutylicum DSM 13864 TaxID=1345695 RepID=U5MUE5_CLOSA|nr:hypothetical protein [Clostridium saccharobutylicum]AGX44225.1 hypothetical protein CLSA_c32600 [Clostridium saccharobutylicum DSM 13864]AQR91512.1 hypothetical protein CLOSC_32380 [Clostridium saccharobutylicum]AQS01417.1 hypothetical protein CSACC_32460 [Clostridium saccharobutylicum]AQS11026.1 hypothetical protein CLOBY_31760 [Clostridium saccharobutylicum]AQS15400.1 hypothetical protein CLOSACC_32460 [Clostridium saccharobutylicum]